jgi:N-acetylneuraminic acid mutarotase
MSRHISATAVICTLLVACASDDRSGVTSPRASDDVLLAKGGSPQGWASHAPMPLPREGTCIAGIGDNIYVLEGYGPPFGDSRTLQIYDIAHNSWSAGPTSLIRRSEGVGVAHGGRLFCIGGRTFGSQNAVEIYDPSSETCSLGTPMPTPRRGLAAAVVGDRIYAMGGSNGSTPRSGTPSSVNEIYDVAANSWSSGTPMPTPRMDVVSVAHGGKIYVVGGWNRFLCGGACNTLEIYDPAHDSWTAGPPMPTARGSLTVETRGNTLYAIAGATTFTVLTTINEAYDIDNNTWTPAPPKPTATAETFSFTHGGRSYIIGGGFFGIGFLPIPGAVNESFRP